MEATYQQPASGLGSVEETNRLLGGDFFHEDTGRAINTVSATSLTSTPTPLNTDYPKTGSASLGLIDSARSVRDSAVKSYQDELAQLGTDQTSGSKDMQTLWSKLGMQSTNQDAEYKKQGIYDMKKEVDSISSQMDARDLYYRRQIEDLQAKNPEGMWKSGLAIETDRLAGQSAREQADLAIVLSAKTKQFDTAKSMVDAKIEAETDLLKTQLQARQWFFEQNKSRMSELEQKTWTTALLDDQRKYEDTKANLASIANIQLAAAKNGAPYSVISAIGKQTDLSSAIVTAGSYLDENSGSGAIGANGGFGKVGSITPSGNTQLFTAAQLETGAAQAHMNVSEFNDLNNDVKNFWIRNSTDAGKIYDAIQTAVASKDPQAIQEIRDSIMASTAPDSIKNYFLGMIDEQTGGTAAESGGGLWNTVKSFFGKFI